MAIDPRLSLLATAPQVPIPDFGQTMLTAEQILAQRQLAQQRTLQLSELLRKRQADLDVEQFFRNQGRGSTMPLSSLAPTSAAPSMASSVPPALSGTYAQDPRQSPTYGYDQLSSGTQAPPGTTYSRAPAAMQPPALQSPEAVPLPTT